MKIRTISILIGSVVIVTGLVSLSSISIAKAEKNKNKSSVSLKNVYFLYAANWRGDKGFERRLQRDIANLGFKWTRDKSQAQALVDANTRWSNGAFWGELTFRDLQNRIIWHETAYRPRNSNQMASYTLRDKLRAAVKEARAQ